MDIPLLGRCWMLAMVSPVTPIIGACLFRTDSDLFCLYSTLCLDKGHSTIPHSWLHVIFIRLKSTRCHPHAVQGISCRFSSKRLYFFIGLASFTERCWV